MRHGMLLFQAHRSTVISDFLYGQTQSVKDSTLC